jgi:hypothetical protein
MEEGAEMRRLLFLAGLMVVALLVIGGPAYAVTGPITYYVNDDAAGVNDGTSWDNALTDLQSALTVAVAGDQIWVAAGTYKPSLSIDASSDARTASFSLKSGVALYGGFAGDENQLDKRSSDPALTVLSGDIGVVGDATDNSYHVVYANAVTGAVLDGFTVTGGRGDRASSQRDIKGGGLYVSESLLTVSDCVFSANRVQGAAYGPVACGAGMCNLNSAPTVTDCVFTSNQAGGNPGSGVYGRGGGMYNFGYYYSSDLYETWPRVTGCSFSANVAYAAYDLDDGGGGMYNGAGEARVESCTFEGNSAGNGGAMLNYMGGPILTNCLFSNNFTTYGDGRGGAISNVANPTILNCTFYKNGWRLLTSGYEPRYRPYTSQGGAVYFTRAGGTITNCIFSENAVKGDGGALFYSGGRGGTLTNNLFYENISWWPGVWPREIDHVKGVLPVAFTQYGNLYDLDPLLADPAAGDFHIAYNSPCVDAGERLKHGNLSWPALPATDFYGNKRVVDGDADGTPKVDIGADEYVPDLPGLQGFLTKLSVAGDIDQTLASQLLADVDAASAALAQEDKAGAKAALSDLIADAKTSLGEAPTALLIEARTQAVIEEI